MKSIIYTLIFLAALTGLLFILPSPKETDVRESENNTTITDSKAAITSTNNTFRLTNITWFDGRKWHENSELLVEDGRIINGSPNSVPEPNQFDLIDGKKGYVIPGLIDAHTHTWGNALQQALTFGVTTELDMFSDVTFGQQAKLSRAKNDKTTQADFYSAGTLMTSPGGHGTQFGFAIPTIETPEQADQFILDRINEGSDFIKIVYHHQDDYHGLTAISKEVLIAAIEASHKYQKLAVVHISDHQSAVEAVAAGADGLVHTFGDQIISDDLLTAMQEQQVFIVPTLSVIASMAQSEHSTELAADKDLSQLLSDTAKNGMKPFSNFSQRPDTLATAIENTKLMFEHGIVVLAGSDAPNPGTAHGISMHGELDLLNQAGLSPTAALQAAGIHAAEQFPIGKRGQLTIGSKADFLWLSADPRVDIKNTRKINSVWKNGYQVQMPDFSQSSMTMAGITLPDSGLISDFSNNAIQSSLNTTFQPTSDQMMQGNSTAKVSWTDSACDGGGLLVEGQINAGFPYAWSGAFLPFAENMDQTINLKDLQSIDFSVSGDTGTYQLMVFTLHNIQPIQIPFEITEDCQQKSIVFAQHPTVDWSQISGLAWVADRSRLNPALASFAFKLDNVVIK